MRPQCVVSQYGILMCFNSYVMSGWHISEPVSHFPCHPFPGEETATKVDHLPENGDC